MEVSYNEKRPAGKETGDRSQESEVRSQESGDRSQESGVRSQKSEVRSQETDVRVAATRIGTQCGAEGHNQSEHLAYAPFGNIGRWPMVNEKCRRKSAQKEAPPTQGPGLPITSRPPTRCRRSARGAEGCGRRLRGTNGSAR